MFHVTHVVSANAIYELPFGKARGGSTRAEWPMRSSAAGRLRRSSRGRAARRSASRRRAARSTAPGARTATTPSAATRPSAPCRQRRSRACSASTSRSTDKIYWIDPKVVGPVTDAPSAPTTWRTPPGSTGQVFFNPAAGRSRQPLDPDLRRSVAVPRRPRALEADRVTDRHRFEVKGEAFNLTNTPSFFRGDMDINSRRSVASRASTSARASSSCR